MTCCSRSYPWVQNQEDRLYLDHLTPQTKKTTPSLGLPPYLLNNCEQIAMTRKTDGAH